MTIAVDDQPNGTRSVGRRCAPSLLSARRYRQHVGMTVEDQAGEHRRRMRARGYRPVQRWVHAVRTPEFAAEARRQSALVARADQFSDDQDFVEAASAPWDEE